MQTFGTIRLNKKFDWLAEVQWRRTEGLTAPQQLLLRSAIQYRLNNQVSFATGYAWIETYPYGDFPIAANGTFPERRIYEQAVIKQSLGKLSMNHRFRVEQRWIGRRAAGTERQIEEWIFSNRFRYLVRLQLPVVNTTQFNLYAAAADEIFINAGKKVGINIFDQNRVHFLLGSSLNSHLGLEVGYVKQTVQQGRRNSNNNTVIQNNDGVTVAVLVNF